MGKIAKGGNEINFTMMYGIFCHIIIENYPQKFSPCAESLSQNIKLCRTEVYNLLLFFTAAFLFFVSNYFII